MNAREMIAAALRDADAEDTGDGAAIAEYGEVCRVRASREPRLARLLGAALDVVEAAQILWDYNGGVIGGDFYSKYPGMTGHHVMSGMRAALAAFDLATAETEEQA